MREWVPSSHARLEAFEGYALGRPKVDQIEVRFITDANTLVANVLAGEVDITAPRALSIEQGLAIRDRWPEGQVLPYARGWTMMYPQVHRPSPAVIGDPQFRRALVHAVNRQELAETLTAGFAPVAHSIIPPDHASYRSVESSIVRYDFDPRKATSLIAELGLSRGSDGVFQDRNGEPLNAQIQTTVNDTNQKTAFAAASFWQQIGIAAEVKTIPPSRVGVWEERYSYGGFDLVNQPHGTDGIRKLLHSSAAPLPERGYRAPNAPANRGSYVNPEYDQLLDRYLATIALPERLQLLAQLVHRQTNEQLVIGFFYSVNAVVMANRVQNATPGTSWNAHEWDVR
jgi:peptide/nickel transport system substrate-binding protein